MSEGSFECKVSGKRESANGIFLTLQIQPDDHTAALAMLRVGSALMIGWAEVVNTAVEPIEIEHGSNATSPAYPSGRKQGGVVESPTADQVVTDPSKAHADLTAGETATLQTRRPFASLPLSQQAAMRTQDSQFQDFLQETMSSVHRNRENWTWADEVRSRCACHESRSEIIDGTTQGRLWAQLEAGFQAYITDKKYASVAR